MVENISDRADLLTPERFYPAGRHIPMGAHVAPCVHFGETMSEHNWIYSQRALKSASKNMTPLNVVCFLRLLIKTWRHCYSLF